MTDTRIAVFDLDGTITRHDTLVPFLTGWASRHPGRLWHLWRLPFSLVRFALGLSDRGRLKSTVIRQVMRGANRKDIAAWADQFCRTRLHELLNPGAVAAIERHRNAGDHLILLSASVDLYVPAVGRTLGFDEVICTGLSWSGDLLEGELTTENRRGAEKRRCIQQVRARFPGARIAAYGNAASDFEHLVAVDEPLLVNASSATRRRGAKLGLACGNWRA